MDNQNFCSFIFEDYLLSFICVMIVQIFVINNKLSVKTVKIRSIENLHDECSNRIRCKIFTYLHFICLALTERPNFTRCTVTDLNNICDCILENRPY